MSFLNFWRNNQKIKNVGMSISSRRNLMQFRTNSNLFLEFLSLQFIHRYVYHRTRPKSYYAHMWTKTDNHGIESL